MNSLVTQDPWIFVPRLETEINRLFGNANKSDRRSATATWVPAGKARDADANVASQAFSPIS